MPDAALLYIANNTFKPIFDLHFKKYWLHNYRSRHFNYTMISKWRFDEVMCSIQAF